MRSVPPAPPLRCKCGGEMYRDRSCGVWVCYDCDYHDGLVRCYCGWSLTNPGQGVRELIEMGENLEPEEYDGW